MASKSPTKAKLQQAARALGVSDAGTKAQIQSRITSFGYNAVEDKGRRQSPQKSVKHESLVLTPKKRAKLQATAQDQARNHALVAWMVRKHLDYTSKFHVSFKTDNPELDNLVNRLLSWNGRPQNFDVCGRFGRDEFMRLFEMEKVLNGDAAIIKLQDGRNQAIESDLIAPGKAPQGEQLPEGINGSGLVIGSNGEVEQYSICNRGPDGKTVTHDHLEPSENVVFDAYWTRFGSQFRGVSPLSTAINTVQDIHEGFEFNLIKAKMHALFGLAIMRGANEPGEMGGAGGSLDETTSGAAPTASDTHLDLKPDAVNLLDLVQGDDVKVIESGTPSAEFVNGSYLFIQIALLSLDIPITSFDSRRSSFSARIADLNEYEVSVGAKRTKNRYVLQDLSDHLIDVVWESESWRLGEVAGRADMTPRQVKDAIEWVPAGSPWLDKAKQIAGDKLAIEIGEDNPIDAARRKGSDVFANIDKTARVIEYAKEKGVPLSVSSVSNKTVEDLVMDAAAAGAQQEQQNDE